MYKVKNGDTLWSIGNRFGIHWTKLQEINELENPDLIFEGQVIYLSKKDKPTFKTWDDF
jgi:spore germination protein